MSDQPADASALLAALPDHGLAAETIVNDIRAARQERSDQLEAARKGAKSALPDPPEST